MGSENEAGATNNLYRTPSLMANEKLEVCQHCSCGCIAAENIPHYDLVNPVKCILKHMAEPIYDKTHYDEKHTSLIWYKVIEQSRLTALFSGQLEMSLSITMAYTLNCRKYELFLSLSFKEAQMRIAHCQILCKLCPGPFTFYSGLCSLKGHSS